MPLHQIQTDDAQIIASEKLACQAVHALIEEARLTPKPGLVDARGSGAHNDMDLPLLEKSAHALHECFSDMAYVAMQGFSKRHLRREIGAIGREGEKQMMQATGGVNTHRGAIWALGLLVTASALVDEDAKDGCIADIAGAIAREPDTQCPKRFSKGQYAVHRYHVGGARAEAMRGFPHVTNIGLPTLQHFRALGVDENYARINALLAIMADLDDTCVLARAGMSALVWMRELSAEILNLGGCQTQQGSHLLRVLDEGMLHKRISPGGAADLLAATLFLDARLTHKE